jgi:oligoendopeptidase F
MPKIKTNSTAWNLTPLFNGDDDPRIEENIEEVEKVCDDFVKKWSERTDYLKDPKILKEALDEYENWLSHYNTDGDAGYYFHLRASLEQDNPKIKARLNKIADLSAEISNKMQFFMHRLAKIPAEDQKKILEDPSLENYKHYFELLFENAKYLLSEEEEKILTLKSSTSYANWVNMVSEFISKEEAEIPDEKGKKTTKSFAELTSLLNDKNKGVRDAAAEAFNRIQSKHVDVAEHEINSILQNKKVNDRLRGLDRPDKARHVSDDIDSEVVDVLIETVRKRFDISGRYYKLKANLLGVEKLKYHERNLFYGDADKKFTYDEAVQITGETFKGLDIEFFETFKEFVENGHIDVNPKKGKSDGAFCTHFLKTQPTYVLLNYTNTVGDVTTLAHEMGHAIHFETLREFQNELNGYAPTSVVEVPSTFFEDFVLNKILKESDDEIRLSLMMTKLNSDVSSIQRQLACYIFEQDLHKSYGESGYLSKNDIGKLFTKNMEAYMGDYVEQSEGSENWWVYWGHIRQFFYVYSYAAGLLISKAFQNEVKANSENIRKFKTFLMTGSSESPKDSFNKMGIDITNSLFWNKGLDEQEKLLEETESLAKKLGKI